MFKNKSKGYYRLHLSITILFCVISLGCVYAWLGMEITPKPDWRERVQVDELEYPQLRLDYSRAKFQYDRNSDNARDFIKAHKLRTLLPWELSMVPQIERMLDNGMNEMEIYRSLKPLCQDRTTLIQLIIKVQHGAVNTASEGPLYSFNLIVKDLDTVRKANRTYERTYADYEKSTSRLKNFYLGCLLLAPLYWALLVMFEWVRSGYTQKETLSPVQDTAVVHQPLDNTLLSTASKPTSSTLLQVKGSESVDELMALVQGAEEEQKEAAVGLIHITLIMGGERGKQKLEAFRSRMEKSHPDLLKEIPYDAEEEEASVKTKRPSLLLRNNWFRSSLLFVVFWMVCGAIRGDVELIMNSRATGTAIGMALGAGLPWAVLIGLPIIILINGRIGKNQV